MTKPKQEWKAGAKVRVGFLEYQCVRDLGSGQWILSRFNAKREPKLFHYLPFHGCMEITEEMARSFVECARRQEEFARSQQLSLDLVADAHGKLIQELSK